MHGTKQHPGAISARATILQVLAERAGERPDAQAYAVLGRSGEVRASLTYGKLAGKVDAVAAALAGRVAAGDRVLLLFSSPLEFLVGFLGTLALGAIAVPAPAPEASRLKRTWPRLQAILADCAPACVLADRAIDSLFANGNAGFGEFAALTRLVTDDLAAAQAPPAHVPAADDIAYLQYTSGSTASPRGVVVTHENLMANLAVGRALWRYDRSSVAVNWMPYFHDYGLVEGLLQPLNSGIPSYQIPTVNFLRAPRLWLDAITRFGGTHSAAPDFGYDYCINRLAPAERAGLDLASWRVASAGAEIVRPQTLRRFVDAYGPHGFSPAAFVPSYGLAEVTLLATATAPAAAPRVLAVDPAALGRGEVALPDASGRSLELTSCGGAGPGLEVAIADPDTHLRCGAGRVGEIWLRGTSVARGYWGNEAASQDVFGARLAGDPQPWMRTGDLGFMRDGDLFITGRRKDVIIIRGTNHFPLDLEASVRSAHPVLAHSECAAFSIETSGEERVVVIAEIDNQVADTEFPAILSSIRQALAEAHDIGLYAASLVRRGGVPKTSSGKVQRSACRAAWEQGDIGTVRAEFRLTGRDADAPGARQDSRLRADAMISWLRDYAPRRIDLKLMDERRMMPPNAVLDFGNRGLLGMQAPVALGGSELATVDLVRVLEQVGAIDLSLGVFTVLHNALGLRPILRAADPALRNRLVPAIASGRELAAFALTEPGAGSNVRGIATTARPAGESAWTLQGAKIWSGSSAWAGAINVFARQVAADGGPAGISGFVVREGMAGVRLGREAPTMGLRATIQNTVHLDGVPVTRTDMLGAPGEGLAVAQDAMMFTRLCLAAICLGAMKRLAQLMLRYGERRAVSTGMLAQNPEFLLRLSRAAAAIDVVEALVARAAERSDADDPDVELLHVACKIIAPEMLWRAADDAMQLIGGRAYMENNAVARFFRDARGIRVFEGPTETLRHHLGARALDDSAGVTRLLERTLAAPQLAAQLRKTLPGLAERCARRAGSLAQAGRAPQWAALLAGDVAVWSIALACLPASAQTSRTWCEDRLAEALAALDGAPDERSAVELSALRDALGRWTESIGVDHETDAGGVERATDALLRAEMPAQPARVVAPAPVVAELPRVPRPAKGLASWLESWLADHLGTGAAEIDHDRPFASYGLESVTATRLALDLGRHLDRLLDPTLVWDYPSIRKLAAHLEGGGEVPATHARASDAASDAEDDLYRLLEEMGRANG